MQEKDEYKLVSGSKTLNMTGYQWWNEATHGVKGYFPGRYLETE